jgi:SynChlorMet cassette protein ScmD
MRHLAPVPHSSILPVLPPPVSAPARVFSVATGEIVAMADSIQPIASPVVVLREEFDDWAVLYNPDNATAVGVNPVGVAVWKLLDGSHTVAQIAESVAAQFEGAPEATGEHVGEFVADLIRRGFVGRELRAGGA